MTTCSVVRNETDRQADSPRAFRYGAGQRRPDNTGCARNPGLYLRVDNLATVVAVKACHFHYLFE